MFCLHVCLYHVLQSLQKPEKVLDPQAAPRDCFKLPCVCLGMESRFSGRATSPAQLFKRFCFYFMYMNVCLYICIMCLVPVEAIREYQILLELKLKMVESHAH